MNKIIKYIKEKDCLDLLNTIISSTNKKYINERILFLKKNRIEYTKKLKISSKEKYKKINSIKKIPLYEYKKGLPIGNMTSQILAIFYLNEIDHYIKENLKYKYYIRYMDDIIIIDTDKERLKKDYKLIVNKIKELKLDINSKSNIYKLSNGISFLGYNFKIVNNRLIIGYNN